MRLLTAGFATCLALLAWGCGKPATGLPPMTTASSGLAYADLAEGQGPTPRIGQTCVVHALGWVEEGGRAGRLFLDTRKRGYPDTFPLGVGRVIQGWDEGLAGMKKGGRRLLRVPPALGYNAKELGEDIPSGATLRFELELIDIR